MSSPFGSGSFGSSPFSLTPFFTTKELIDAILRDTGHNSYSQETLKRQIVLTAINNRYTRIAAARHWEWLYQTQDMIFEDPYSAGTITATKGSNIITGVGTGWNASLVPDRKIIIKNEIYVIQKINSPTEIELEGRFAGESGSAYTYRIVKPTYTMPSNVDHLRSVLVDTVGEMVPLGVQEFRRKIQYDPAYIGIPRWYTETKRREDGQRSFEIWPNPDKKYSVHLDFQSSLIRLEDDAENFPLIPDRYRMVLYYGGRAEMHAYLKDPTNAQLSEADFQRVFTMMQNDNTLTESRYIIEPGRNYKARRRRRRYRLAIDRSDFARDDYY